MNRRNLLKRAGVATLAAPFLAAGTLLDRGAAQSVSGKSLMIIFSGPFVFRMLADKIRVMAPLVGPYDLDVAHQPWLGTTSNEKSLRDIATPALKLCMGLTPNPQPPAGLPMLSFPQPDYESYGTALFSLDVPDPDQIVGIHPTDVCLGVCASDGSNKITCASGAIFLYNHVVDLSKVVVVAVDLSTMTPGDVIYTPDFQIDINALPAAVLGVHLSPCNCGSDPCHVHATTVVHRMKDMCSWIPDLRFPNSEPCPLTVSGDDCKAPVIMV
jgi:hypothetical protein